MNLHDYLISKDRPWNFGVVTLENGEIGYTSLEFDQRTGRFDVRVESGWYWEFSAEGVRTRPAVGLSGRNMVSFEPMAYEEAQAKYLDIRCGFHP